MSRIDPDALAIVARNLIENALKHGARGEKVKVTLSAGRVLSVVNEGPVTPPDILARLSQPFERGQTLAEGSGMGLAIVKAIAAGTGGKVDLISPAAGRQSGFEARFALPEAR